ncbi:hypothetical protein [Priestia sp. J2]|uniref:hypothetical protein n=1 Tax=Priestia sp. J2 TaxID=2886505 RepID=UPI001E43A5F6|nr:hypothetical protein [Priestia sp. J2]
MIYKSTVLKAFKDKDTGRHYGIGGFFSSEDSERVAYLGDLGFVDKEVKEIEPVVETKQKETADKPPFKHVGGGWYELADGSRVKGKQKALEAIESR